MLCFQVEDEIFHVMSFFIFIFFTRIEMFDFF